jgi:hypothetical protein
MSGRGEDPPRDYSSPTSRPTDTDEATNRRARQLRAEIEDTREELSETIEAIQERLTPGNIVASATERVRTATTEGVKNMAETASETARSAMYRTREMADDFGLRDMASRNRIPLAMIGAGAAWLLIDRMRNGQRYERYDRWERHRASYGYGRDDYDPSGRYYGGERTRELSSRSGWSETSDRITSSAKDAGYAVPRTTRRAQNRLERLMHENPLVAGAAAAVVGAAVGMALPETERENEWLGEAKETVVDRAQDIARNAANAVQEAAGDMAGEVAKTVVGGGMTREEKS